MTNAEKVMEFHQAFNLDIDKEFEDRKILDLRISLLREEFLELMVELEQPVVSRSKTLKELCDLLYVTYGLAIAFGLPVDYGFNEVHKSNMSKLGLDGKPVYREDGKALKGPNYKPPEFNEVLV